MMKEYAALKEINSKLLETNQKLLDENKFLYEQIRLLKLNTFGSKSEKNFNNDTQVSLFEIDEDCGEQEAPKPDQQLENSDEKTENSKQNTKRPGRKPIPGDLPRHDRIIDLHPDEKFCCGKEMRFLKYDISECIEHIPAFYYVVRLLIAKYTCTHCNGENGCFGTIATADLPTRILPGSSAGNSIVAEVVANKIVDGLPCYRQAKRFERFGLTISRKTITNWLLSVAKKCHVLDKLLLESALATGAIQMDETFFQVMGEEGRKNQTDSYMWVIRSGGPLPPVIYYAYHPTRSSSVPTRLLSGYKGSVQTDGYKGYDFLESLKDVTLVACWAHARRKFTDAVKTSDKRKSTARKLTYAEEVLRMISALYAVEKKAVKQNLPPESVKALRTAESLPLLAKIKASLDSHLDKFPEQSMVGKAIRYTLRLWPRLVRYAESGHVAIDNNLVENVIRPFVVGRKNWLFAGSPEGANTLGILYSLLETAKANGWEPYAYLRFLFDRLPNAVGEEEHRKLLPNIAKPIPMSSFVGEAGMKLTIATS